MQLSLKGLHSLRPPGWYAPLLCEVIVDGEDRVITVQQSVAIVSAEIFSIEGGDEHLCHNARERLQVHVHLIGSASCRERFGV